MKNKKVIIISSVVLALILVFAITVVALGTSDNGRIAPKVFVLDEDVSGKTVEEAVEIITLKYLEADPSVDVNCNGNSVQVKLSEFGQVDFDATVKNAYQTGRGGNIFTRATAKIFPKKTVIPLSLVINEDMFREKVSIQFNSFESAYKEEDYEISGDKLTVTVGHSGDIIAFEDFESIIKTLGLNKNAKADAKSSFKEYSGVDVDALYEVVCTEPVNAYYDKDGGKLVPHIVGYSFDKEEVKNLLNGLKNGEQIEINLDITMPDVLEEDLTGQMFKDVLASFSTNYNTAEVDRTYNMILAAQKVNGTVLEPGAVFSYNGVVGARTVAAGYRNAKIFENGRVVDGLAGGICQVSSTIYNAALYSDMEIVERKNHSFPVAYTPMGQDATVVMGAIDFKFKNTTSRPVKITSTVSGGVCKVEILGTKERNFRVEIINSVVGHKPRPVEYEEDPAIEKGVEKVVQNGSDGYTVKTVRKVYVNGELVKTESMPTSYYTPLKKIIKRNTKEEEVPEEPAEGEQMPENPAEGNVQPPEEGNPAVGEQVPVPQPQPQTPPAVTEPTEPQTPPAVTEPNEPQTPPAVTEPTEPQTPPAVTEPTEPQTPPVVTEPTEPQTPPVATEPGIVQQPEISGVSAEPEFIKQFESNESGI